MSMNNELPLSAMPYFQMRDGKVELGISISENAWKRMNILNISMNEVFKIMFNTPIETTVLNRVYLSNGINTVITDLKQKFIVDVTKGVK